MSSDCIRLNVESISLAGKLTSISFLLEMLPFAEFNKHSTEKVLGTCMMVNAYLGPSTAGWVSEQVAVLTSSAIDLGTECPLCKQ